MDVDLQPVVCLGNRPPTINEITHIASSPISPKVTLDPKIVARNETHWTRYFAKDSEDEWMPIPRPTRQATMPTTGNIGVGDASIPVVDRAVVRATAVLRIASLLDQASGVRMDFVETLVEMLNENTLPTLEASFTDEQALEKFAERVYMRKKTQFLAQSKSGGNEQTQGTAKLPASSVATAFAQWEGGRPGGDHAEYDAQLPVILSQPEALVFTSGTCFSVARTLLTVQLSQSCSLLANCATALSAEACRLPLNFIDAADGSACSGTTCVSPLAFPGGKEAVDSMLWLLNESKIQRVPADDVSPVVMEAVASLPMYTGTLTECLSPVFNLLRAEIACSSQRSLVMAANNSLENSQTANANTSKRRVLLSEVRRVETLNASVLSQVEVMVRMCLALLTIVEGTLPRYQEAAEEPPVDLPQPPEGIDPDSIPLEDNPITAESLERVKVRLTALKSSALTLAGEEDPDIESMESSPAVPRLRGEVVGGVLLEVLVLQICTALQLLAHDEVRLYIRNAGKQKKHASYKLHIGQAVDKFRDLAIDLIDRHAPPNKRDQMMSQSESILHAALGKVGLASPEIREELESILRPQNQGTRIPKVPKGTQDFSPLRMAIREDIFDKIKLTFHKHGAVQIDTPVFELKETLLGKYGEDQKLIYDLKDQGGEKLSLRYDLTVPFARYVATHNVEKIKRYHIGKVYRRDEPQMARGRFREFYQCDIDIAGTGYDRMVPDAEILTVLVESLRLLSPQIGDQFVVKLNHRLLLDAVMAVCGVPADMFRAICSAVDKLDKEPWEVVKLEMTEQKGLAEESADKIREFVFMKGTTAEIIRDLRANAQLCTLDDAKTALDDLELLFEYLEVLGVTDKVNLDMSLARGLDYYTGVIYEAITVGEKVGSIAAGGRYDKLVGMFSGRDVPAVGVSLGVERLFRIAEQNLLPATAVTSETSPKKGKVKTKKQVQSATPAVGNVPVPVHTGTPIRESATAVLVCSIGGNLTKKRMELCQVLRRGGVPAEYAFNDKQKLPRQLSQANKQQIPLVVIFGESEIAAGTLKIKKFKYNGITATGTEEGSTAAEEIEVSTSELVTEVKRLLKDS